MKKKNDNHRFNTIVVQVELSVIRKLHFFSDLQILKWTLLHRVSKFLHLSTTCMDRLSKIIHKSNKVKFLGKPDRSNKMYIK